MRHFSEKYPFANQLDLETTPLIRIGVDGIHSYEQKRNGKVEMLKSRIEGDKFLVPVPGQWRTDVFELTDADFTALQEAGII